MELQYTLEEIRFLADRRPAAGPKLPLPRRPGRRGTRRLK
jgi:hypothetical protein